MASLSGSVTTTNPDFNIDTTDGQGNAITTTDWVHWTNTGGTSQRKSGGGSLISNYTAFNGLENQFTGYARTISWTNGTPTASGSDQTGIYLAATGAGSGFTFTFPADSLVLRTAYVFIGGFLSTLNFTAHLSDSSATDYTDNGGGDTGANYVRNYKLTYQSASDSQTLTITYSLASGAGNVNIFGASLVVGVAGATFVPHQVYMMPFLAQ